MDEIIKYDQNYYDGLLRMYSPTAQAINHIRWLWVAEANAVHVLDFGSGIGWFRAFAPEGYEVDTVDLMPVIQTGIRRTDYDLITLWDVVEHLTAYQFETILPMLKKADNLALTVPIYPGHENDIESWKHWKPGEHLRYFFEPNEVEGLLAPYGFRCVKRGYVECPPRQDICSYLFKNEGKGNGQ